MAFSRETHTVTDCGRFQEWNTFMRGMWRQQRFWRMPQEKHERIQVAARAPFKGLRCLHEAPRLLRGEASQLGRIQRGIPKNKKGKFSEWACARLPDTVASEDVGRLSMRAAVEITGVSKCSVKEHFAMLEMLERELYKGHWLHELIRARDKVAGRRSEGPSRDARISTSPDGWRNICVGQFFSTRRFAQFDTAAVEVMVPTSKQATLVSKLLDERRVIILVGVVDVDCNSGVD